MAITLFVKRRNMVSRCHLTYRRTTRMDVLLLWPTCVYVLNDQMIISMVHMLHVSNVHGNLGDVIAQHVRVNILTFFIHSLCHLLFSFFCLLVVFICNTCVDWGGHLTLRATNLHANEARFFLYTSFASKFVTGTIHHSNFPISWGVVT
jgi:hypothetical protein